MNSPLSTALISMAAAQLIKVPVKYLQHGEWDPGIIFETGGMPSSHSAGVASLATRIALKKGMSSIPFALAATYGLIVMYDAMGIRRHAGEIATEVNLLRSEFRDMELDYGGDDESGVQEMQKELKERLGHLPAEVVAGAALGTLIGFISHAYGSKRRLWQFR